MEQHLKTAGQTLAGNSYPGRGIVAGLSPDGRCAAAAYFIMGRSRNSRNRIFIPTDDGIATAPLDPALVEDPTLIFYHPVRLLGDCLVVTNGDQTDTICTFLRRGESAEAALKTRTYEPDAPNFTPRISACLHLRQPFSYEMSILRRASAQAPACQRLQWQFRPCAGAGSLLHTYRCDGTPLPSFPGDPIPVAIPSTAHALCEDLWQQLDQNNRIALYVRYTDLQTGEITERLINRAQENKEAQ